VDSEGILRRLRLAAWLVLLLFPGLVAAYNTGGSRLYSQNVIKVATFPDHESIQHAFGKEFDAGWCYERITLLFVPVWNFEGRWCGYSSQSLAPGIEVGKVVLDSIASSQGVFLPSKPSLPPRETIGGKIALLAVLGLGLVGAIRYFSPNQS
jgi:hypothetical protein